MQRTLKSISCTAWELPYRKINQPARKLNRLIKLEILTKKFIKNQNFCQNLSKKTKYGFNTIYGFRENAKFSRNSPRLIAFIASFIFAKKCEISWKSLRNAKENLRIFFVTFRSLETLGAMFIRKVF